MRGFAGESHLDVWYDRLIASELVERFGGRLGDKGRILFTKPLARGRRKTSVRVVTKLTETVDGELRFRHVPPLLVPMRAMTDVAHGQEEAEFVRDVISEYTESLDDERRYLFASYRFVDLARKVVGVGSVGTRAIICLLVGRDGRDPLVLQAKEAQASVLEPYFAPSQYENHGERVVRGQRISHAAVDIFLSWQRSTGFDGNEHDFYVRQLWDWKASIDLSTMTEWGSHSYTRACGWSLARAHARSGDRLAIAAYLGKSPAFEEAVAPFARTYADQNERDHERLLDAVADGMGPVLNGA